MTLPNWIGATEAPKDTALLDRYLTEALAFVAEAKGHLAFARHVRQGSMLDLFRPLCELAWHSRQEWEVETFRFWAAFPAVERDVELVDMMDTVCMMTPLGCPQDEDEADAYWPDLVATVRGLAQLS